MLETLARISRAVASEARLAVFAQPDRKAGGPALRHPRRARRDHFRTCSENRLRLSAKGVNSAVS